MGNLALDPEFQRRAIEDAKIAQRRNLSRYGNRESIDELPEDQGSWFVLRCHGNSERLAAAGLIARRFNVYLPVVWIKERAGRVHQERERPMFSTYLFIRCLPHAGHWNRVRNVAGVQCFLGDGPPEPMPPTAIDAVRRAEAEFATKAGKKSLRWQFEIGDDIRVIDGPFASFYGQLVSAVDDRGRIMALIDIFGRKTRAEFDADQLEKC